MTEIMGDVGGLYDIAGQISRAQQPLQDSAKSINGAVSALVNDAGWYGEAASGFRGAWQRDSTVMSMTANFIESVASALTDLAHGLTSAQSHIYNAQDAAERSGIRFEKDGSVEAGSMEGSSTTAWTTYLGAVKHAQEMAQDARETAKRQIYAALLLTNPQLPGSNGDLLTQDDAAAASLMRDYVYLPRDLQKKDFEKQLASFKDYYDNLKYDRAHAGNAELKRVLTKEMQGMRAEMRSARADLAAVTSYEEEAMKGKWFNKASLGDLLDKIGGDSRWVRIGDSLPDIDIAAAVLGTVAQARYDHERGWGWTHSVIADGAANVVGLGVGVATAETGPFAPLLAYGASSLVNEYTHSTHWCQNIHNDGVILGVGRSLVEGGWNTLKSDFFDMGEKVIESSMDPAGTAKNLWHGIFG